MSESKTPTPPEILDGMVVIRGSGTCRDWNGIRYKTGMSAGNVGAKQLSMNVARIPPGGVAHAHIHLIPRFRGDVPDPRGGVRHVIPQRAAYWEQV